jgi:hypothetical protein
MSESAVVFSELDASQQAKPFAFFSKRQHVVRAILSVVAALAVGAAAASAQTSAHSAEPGWVVISVNDYPSMSQNRCRSTPP